MTADTPVTKSPPKNTQRDAAATSPNPAFTFLMAFMESRPEAVYADAAAAAKAAGHTIFPIMWGRAQVVLGRVKSKPRGSGKVAVAKSAAERAARNTEAATPPPEEPVSARPVGRPRRPVVAANVAFPISEADLPRLAVLVDALNAGGKAVLRYAGDGWELAVE